MAAGNSCLLGSINLDKFVINEFTSSAKIDIHKLRRTTDIAVRALNKVLDEGLPKHPLQEQRDAVRDWRQIGLGTTSLGTALMRLCIKYGSDESLKIVQTIYKTIAEQAIRTSADLAELQGAYPKCKPELIIETSFFKQFNFEKEFVNKVKKTGLRNCQILTCAPNGSIGTMIGTGSTGIESVFALSYFRTTKTLENKDKTFKIDIPIINEFRSKTNSKELLPSYFVSVNDIKPIDRVKVQAVANQWIDGAISSTCNLPENTTIDEIKELYIQAWKLGCKGCTTFRANCNRIAILSTSEQKSEVMDKTSKITPQYTFIKKVSDDCVGKKRTLMTGCGSLHFTAFFDKTSGELLETYCAKGSQGGCALFMNGLSRMMSLAARGNISVEAIVDQLKSAGTCPSYAVRKATKQDTSKGSCCPVAIGYALMDMYNEMQNELKFKNTQDIKPLQINEIPSGPKCPECGESLNMIEGCMSCNSCGFSRCG